MFRRFHFRKDVKKETSGKEEKSMNTMSTDVRDNLDTLKEILEEPNDLIVRKIEVGTQNHLCAIAYIDGLVDSKAVRNHVLENLQFKTQEKQLPEEKEKLLEELYQAFITVGDAQKGETLEHVLNAVLSGDTVCFVDGTSTVLIMDTKGGEFRSIKEPVSETLIRGPREGFVENLGTNIVMIRRNIHDPHLRFKTHQIGKRSKKNLVVTYIDGVVHPKLVEEVNRRIKSIHTDNAPESGYIEEWLEDSFLSPFPQMINTERPDNVASALLEGKVAVLLDGTPFALIMPIFLGDVLKSPEDYYERWTVGSLIRILRYAGAFISLFLPAMYIALVSFHQGLLPSGIAFSIAATREGVPFPVFAEAILMVVTMELLREAGARLPQTIGQTIGIVGGLVIGEAAVQAGIVSPIMVIVIALTAISTFSIPLYSVAISFRLLRFGIMFAAALFGLYGIILAYIMINIHIVNLKSFGVPYSTPFAPTILKDWKDLVLRAPVPSLENRPKYLQTQDSSKAKEKDHGMV